MFEHCVGRAGTVVPRTLSKTTVRTAHVAARLLGGILRPRRSSRLEFSRTGLLRTQLVKCFFGEFLFQLSTLVAAASHHYAAFVSRTTDSQKC